MKTTFLQVGEKQIFPELAQNPVHSLNVWVAEILGID